MGETGDYVQITAEISGEEATVALGRLVAFGGAGNDTAVGIQAAHTFIGGWKRFSRINGCFQRL